MTINRGPGDDAGDACTCAACIEVRTRPAARANLEPLEIPPDEIHLQAGMNAIARYVKEQAMDGDYTPLKACFYDIEIRELTLIRSACLRKAVEAEARYQRPVVSGGESGVL